MAACVRLQPQNTEDGLRGTTQTCTARSDELSQRSHCAHVVEARKFSRYVNSTSANNWEGGMATQMDNLGHFRVHDGDFFRKYLLRFEKQSVFR